MARLLINPKPDEDVVVATLAAWSTAPFVWGESDCVLSVLTYLAAATGLPSFAVRSYSSPIGAGRILRELGGLKEAAQIAMDWFGCQVAEEPVRGDVGLIDLPRIGLTACLCLGDGIWAGRGNGEVITARMTPTMAWSVLCRS